MKNRGFTVVELMTTFVLISVIATLLIKLTISLKELYISGDMRTVLLTKQGTLTDKIKNDLNNKVLSEIKSCGDNCITFTYDTGSKNLKVDKTKKIITYDNYSIKLSDSSSFGDIYINKDDLDIGSIIKINVSIKNKLLKGDYGISIVSQINDTITFDNTILTTFNK